MAVVASFCSSSVNGLSKYSKIGFLAVRTVLQNRSCGLSLERTLLLIVSAETNAARVAAAGGRRMPRRRKRRRRRRKRRKRRNTARMKRA